jgi:hypothetical protein
MKRYVRFLMGSALALGAALVCLAAADFAQAGTVTLEQTGPCYYAYFCNGVNNDAGESIGYIVYSPHYGRVTAAIDGVYWDTGLYALGSNNGAIQSTVTLTSVALYDPEGHVIYLTVSFTGGQTTGPCRQSGRVCVYPKAPVYLTGGSVFTP